MSKAKPPARKLKVFVTAIGFHDAYVAAPSRKAALAAWGSTHDLFARGAASEVTDAALAHEPLAHPGEVVKRSRGTREEQLAALGDAPRSRRPAKAAAPSRTTERATPEPPTPPDEAQVTIAAAALEDAQAEAARAVAAIDRERKDLDAREATLRRRLEKDEERLRRDLSEAQADLTARRHRYDRDLAAYRGAQARSTGRGG